MKEEFLHYVWQFSLFSSDELQTTKGERVEVVKSGVLNKNSGPDFLESHLKINGQKWVGNIEIHLKSSDWYAHHHEEDSNYDAVILHVVFEDDVAVFMKNNKALPTLVLKDSIAENILTNYKTLFKNEKRWIPCANDIGAVDGFVLKNWLERLFLERLEDKSNMILNLLDAYQNNYEAVLFQLLAKNFGLKVNGDTFLKLAQKIDFTIVRKERFDAQKLSALIFGVAGFLDDDIEEPYHQQLKSEYLYLKKKYKLSSMNKKEFQFFRMRPNNFPTIRLAQLITVYVKHQNLFATMLSFDNIEQFYDAFDVVVDDFWKTHYTFEKESKSSQKRISKAFVDLVIINTVIPLKFVFKKQRNVDFNLDELRLLEGLIPEKNSIINKFSDLGIKPQNALESQALLQLKNEYCVYKKCLDCTIGNSLLNKKHNVL